MVEIHGIWLGLAFVRYLYFHVHIDKVCSAASPHTTQTPHLQPARQALSGRLKLQATHDVVWEPVTFTQISTQRVTKVVDHTNLTEYRHNTCKGTTMLRQLLGHASLFSATYILMFYITAVEQPGHLASHSRAMGHI